MATNYIIDTLEEEFIPYAGEILLNNLPSVTDGLLPVHRKVLWALYENKVLHNKPFIKMLRASSMAMVYYIFGDMPLTASMKNMANNGLNYFYLEPKGNYGDKRFKEGVGASARYIECKLSEYGEELVKGIDKDSVSMKRNFDNTKYEPIVLPSMIPNILTNPSQSIAVGEASKMPGHNLIDVCEAILSYIEDKDIDKAIDIIKCPDFTLIGGKIVYDKELFRKIYKTGKGSFTLVGSYTYDKKKDLVSIYEIPYETTIEDIETKLRASYDKGLFREITGIHDASGRQGCQLDIYLRKGTNVDQFISKLRRYTPFESKFSCNFTAIDLDGKTPKLMSLKDIIEKWITHRSSCISSEIKYDINKNEVELNKLLGLKTIALDLDKAIELIRQSKNETEAIQKLIEHFKLNQAQAEYIATIRLVNINKDWIHKKVVNVDELKSEIDKLTNIVNSPDKISEIIVEQLQRVKSKYGQPRKTEIIYDDDIQEITQQDLIEDYNIKYYLTEQGYLKKVPLTSLRGGSEQKLKDDDKVISEIESTNKSDLILFSNKGVAYKLKSYEINDTKLSNLGEYLHNILEMEQDEKILHMISTVDYKGYLMVGFADGRIGKISMSAYQTKTNRSKLLNAINTDQPIVNMFTITEDIDIICMSSIDKVLITNTSSINAKSSKNTMGVTVLKSKNDSQMVLFEQLSKVEGIEDIEYYRVDKGVGKYLKKTDKLNMK